MGVLPDQVGRFRCAVKDTGAFLPKVQGEVPVASKVLEGLTGGEARDTATLVREVRAEVGASCVIDPLHDRFGDVQLKARAGAEELDLVEEDLHLGGGVGHEAEVVGIAEYELSASVVVSKA
ncbi:MAG TPA: hypothetical protein VLA31_01310, partial [Burkholderiaceae bacterium]|nr:hypothetical protein [Burkholderiaceae bacterium]